MTRGQGHGPFPILSREVCHGLHYRDLTVPRALVDTHEHTERRPWWSLPPSPLVWHWVCGFGFALGGPSQERTPPSLWLGLDEDDLLAQKILELGRSGGAKGYHLSFTTGGSSLLMLVLMSRMSRSFPLNTIGSAFEMRHQFRPVSACKVETLNAKLTDTSSLPREMPFLI